MRGRIEETIYIYIYIYYDKGRQKKSDAEPLFGQEIQLSFLAFFLFFHFCPIFFKKSLQL